MTNHIYILTRKKELTSYVSADSFDIAILTNLGFNTSSHWWDGFLVTCCESSHEAKILEYITDTDRLEHKTTCQSPTQYHQFTKTWWHKERFASGVNNPL